MTVAHSETAHLTAVTIKVVDDLRWSGIERGAALRIALDLIGHAQQANIAAGGTGAGEQVTAILMAAMRMIGGMVTNSDVVASFDDVVAAVEHVAGTGINTRPSGNA